MDYDKILQKFPWKFLLVRLYYNYIKNPDRNELMRCYHYFGKNHVGFVKPKTLI